MNNSQHKVLLNLLLKYGRLKIIFTVANMHV
ncbi:hypothetical protein T09_11398 [Trichinella sp. T9]|nr:hypothetical protein T09_11398 [Trichinella sp. T9]